MGRPRKRDSYLPKYMYKKGNCYYYVRHNKWESLGNDLNAALHSYADRVALPNHIITVSDLMTAYIQFCIGKRSPATIENYLLNAKNLNAVFGAMKPEHVLKPHVYQYMIRKGNVMANRDKAFLSAAYTFGIRTGLVKGEDPTKKLQFRNHEKARTRYVEDDEFLKLSQSNNRKVAVMSMFLYLTGMRIGDALRMKPGDLDDEGFLYWNTKSKKYQGLLWSPALRECVDEAMTLGNRPGRQWLFESRAKGNGQYTVSGFRSIFKREAKKIGLTDIRLHDMRAKSSSDAESVDVAQALLGHENPAITNKHYRRKVKRNMPAR